jgi:hypothetical protein
VNPPLPLPSRTTLSKITQMPVVAARRRGRHVIDFVTADHVHGAYMIDSHLTVVGQATAHWETCTAMFHLGVPAGRWRVKTYLDPALMTGLESLRHTRAVLVEQALSSGWMPYGGLHTRWAVVGGAATVVAEVGVADSTGRRSPSEPLPKRRRR